MSTGGWKPLLSAVNMASVGQEQPAMIAAEGSIPHHLLLPECNAVMHHGGAGTSAAVLTAGLPHIVCPFHFDQFSWVRFPVPAITHAVTLSHDMNRHRDFVPVQQHLHLLARASAPVSMH